MNNVYVSLIIAAGITFCAIITQNSSENSSSRQYYGIKIYIISFIISYVALIYLTDCNIKQIIETGDADF
jgi:hypothetical protein